MMSDYMMMKTKKTVNETEKSPPEEDTGDFMQLRSRRLNKSAYVIKKRQGKGSSRNSWTSISTSKGKGKWKNKVVVEKDKNLEENVDETVKVDESGVYSIGGGPAAINYFDGVAENVGGGGGGGGDATTEIEGVDVDDGDNLLKNDRENTPENLIIRQDNVIANLSNTIAPRDGVADGGSRINRRLQGGCIPSAKDMDDFFAAFEMKQEKHFMEKYNFDFKNETPLPGRYEWVKVDP